MEAPAGVRDLGDGNPDPALLPSLGPALAAASDAYARRPGMYGDDPVVPELAELVRAGLDSDGVPSGPVALASGSLDAIERV
ncbi:GntR family transcriptional regulator, partial [Streptomyces sp. NRRL S-4]